MYSLIDVEKYENFYKFTWNFLYYLKPWFIMNAKIKIRKYVISVNLNFWYRRYLVFYSKQHTV